MVKHGFGPCFVKRHHGLTGRIWPGNWPLTPSNVAMNPVSIFLQVDSRSFHWLLKYPPLYEPTFLACLHYNGIQKLQKSMLMSKISMHQGHLRRGYIPRISECKTIFDSQMYHVADLHN